MRKLLQGGKTFKKENEMCQQIQYINIKVYSLKRMEVWWGKISTGKKAPLSDPATGKLQASSKMSLTDVNLWPRWERYSVDNQEKNSITTSCTYFQMGYHPVWLYGPRVLITGTQTELTSYLLTVKKGCFFPTYWPWKPMDRECHSQSKTQIYKKDKLLLAI